MKSSNTIILMIAAGPCNEIFDVIIFCAYDRVGIVLKELSKMSYPVFVSMGKVYPSKFSDTCPIRGLSYAQGTWVRACTREDGWVMYVPTETLTILGYREIDGGLFKAHRTLWKKGDDLKAILKAAPNRSLHIMKRDGSWARVHKNNLAAIGMVRSPVSWELV